MDTWTNICRLMGRYADRATEMTYQESIRDFILVNGLGWKPTQIEEQKSMQLGSTERLIPDIVVSRDSRTCFIIEVKRADNICTQRNIEQLVSYMKQLETPVGIYIGNEMKIYYKTIGDGAEPTLVMSLQFNANDSSGDVFVKLFSADDFAIGNIAAYVEKRKAAKAFEANVQKLVEDMTSNDFRDKLTELIVEHYNAEGYTTDEIKAALSQLYIKIKPENKNQAECDSALSKLTTHQSVRLQNVRTGAKEHNITARQYAFNLIKQIIERNHSLSYQQLYDIFGQKNFIIDINNVTDENRWFMDEDKFFQSKDGSIIVVSNQWGFNGNYKPKMEHLRCIAEKYGIDTTIP